MPYKIVQTHEKGKAVLTTVPSEWERDGTLFWPKNKAEKLLKLEFSRPEDNWIPIACTIKRSNLKYQEAENEINSMQYRSDTEEEQQQRRPNESSVLTCSLNELANQCYVVPEDLSNSNNFMHDENNVYILGQETFDQTATLQPAPLESLTEILTTIKETHDKAPPDLILQKLQTIDEKQDKILLKLAEFSVQFQELIKNKPVQQMQEMQNVDNFSPIDNKHELENFENDLRNEEKKYQIYKKYSVVCKGKGKGLNCAYTLIDVLFTRNFLTTCSWAGGSRGDASKIAFKTYKNTISLFYNLIFDCDKSFSITECHTFLKNILRNSTKRNETKYMRTPACKTRLKKTRIPTYKVNSELEDLDHDEENITQVSSSKYNSEKKIRNAELKYKNTNNEEKEEELNETIKISNQREISRSAIKPVREKYDLQENKKKTALSYSLSKKKRNTSPQYPYKNYNKESEGEENIEDESKLKALVPFSSIKKKIETKFSPSRLQEKENLKPILQQKMKIVVSEKKNLNENTENKPSNFSTTLKPKEKVKVTESEMEEADEIQNETVYEKESKKEEEIIERYDDEANKNKINTKLIPNQNRKQKREYLRFKANSQQNNKLIDYEKKYLEENTENKNTTSSSKLKPKKTVNEMESDDGLLSDIEEYEEPKIFTVYETESENDEEILDTTEEKTLLRVNSNNKRNIESSDSDVLDQEYLNMENITKTKPKKIKKLETKNDNNNESNKNKIKHELTPNRKQKREHLRKEVCKEKRYLKKNIENKTSTSSSTLKPKKKLNATVSEIEEAEEIQNETVHEKESENEEEILDTTGEIEPRIEPRVSSNSKMNSETSDSDIVGQEDLNMEKITQQKPKQLKNLKIIERNDDEANTNKIITKLTPKRKQMREKLRSKANSQQNKKEENEKIYLEENTENKSPTSFSKLKSKEKVNEVESDDGLLTDNEEDEEPINVTVYEKNSKNENNEDILNTTEEKTPLSSASDSDVLNQEYFRDNINKPKPKKIKKLETKE